MSASQPAARPSRRRVRSGLAAAGLAALAAALLLALLAAAPALAASQYSGGADVYPLFIPNDHTVAAIHFTVGDPNHLSPNTPYYVKVRFSPGPAPQGTSNRGFTWNPKTGQWIQERSDWTLFPTVTTDAGGHISDAAGWEFAKLADTRIASGSTYYVLVSLSFGGPGNTFNGDVNAPVTIVDMASSGLWLHNGIATGVGAGARAEADLYPLSAPPSVVGLTRTEANGVDEDGNGTVDDEGTAGSFRLGVPTGKDLVVQLSDAIWPLAAAGTTYGTPDTDIALGAADTTPPSRVTGVDGATGSATAHLTWSAATDNIGVTRYRVYRWVDPGSAVPYTAQPMLAGTVNAPATSFDDHGLTNGTNYSYDVRAVDAAGNVGPRSDTDILTPGTAPSAFAVTPGNGVVHLSWTNPTGANFDYVSVVRATGTTAPVAPTDPQQIYQGTGISVDDTTVVNDTTYTYAIWAHDSVLGWSVRVTAPAVTPDGTPPGDITFAEAISHDHHVSLDWHNPTDADFDHAVILRRTDHYPVWNEKGDAKTTEVPVDQLATVATDSGVANGTHCFYTLWAVDQAGNRSGDFHAAHAAATPQAVAALKVSTRTAVVAYGGTAVLTIHMTIDGLNAAKAPLRVQWSANKKTWKNLSACVTGLSGSVTVKVKPSVKTYYRVHFAGNVATRATTSTAVVVTPQVLLGAPVAAATVRHAVAFTVSGILKPRHAVGSHVVRVYCYRLKAGRWVYVRAYLARTIAFSTYSKYTVRISLSVAGQWRLRAYAPADAQHAATWSAYRYVKAT
jgi:hypothetical protein